MTRDTRGLVEKAREFIERQRTVSEKSTWVPYEGPREGVGWRNTDTDEVVYDDEPPGDISIDVTESLDPDDWDDAADALEGLDGGSVHDDLGGMKVGDRVEFEKWDGSVVERDVLGFTMNQGKPRAVLDERDTGGVLDHTKAPPKNIVGTVEAATEDAGESYEGAAEEPEDDETAVEDIGGWESAGDDEVRAAIDHFWDGDEWDGEGDRPDRRQIYDVIGTPPLHNDEFEGSGIDPVDSTDAASDVATRYDTVEELDRAEQDGSLDADIEETHESMTGQPLDLDSLPDDAADAYRDDVRNHVVFDLIWHHPLGRSDEVLDG